VAGQFTTKDPADSEIEASIWARALERHCVDLRDDLIFLAPWLELPTAAGTRPDLPASIIPTLRELALLDAAWAPIIKRARDSGATPEVQESLDALQRLVTQGAERATARMVAIEVLAQQATALTAMDYDFLYDKVRRQLVIGYNVAQRPLRRELLRLAGIGGAFEQFRRRRTGQAAPGKLVRARTFAHVRWGNTDSARMERLDVRIPDASARYAYV
jgi:hypothetical protein